LPSASRGLERDDTAVAPDAAGSRRGDPNGLVPARLGEEKDALSPNQEQLEQAYREAQAQRLRYQELFDFAPDGYLVTDGRGIILEANYAVAALLQVPRPFLPGKPLPLYVAEGWRRDFYLRLTRLCKMVPSERWETVLQPRRGERRNVILTVSAIVEDEEHLTGFRWLVRDNSETRRTKQALRAETDLADSLIDTVEAVVMVIDEQGRITRSNPFLSTISGYRREELIGRSWCALLLPEPEQEQGREMVRRAHLLGTAAAGILPLTTRTGQRRSLAWSAKSLLAEPGTSQLMLFAYDLTKLQEAQQRALQAERLAAIGQMVAGLAHESRNALQRSQSCLTILNYRLHGQPEILDLLSRIQNAQDDLHQLFDEVRDYAGPLHLESHICNLAEVWREAWEDLGEATAEAEIWEETEGTDLRCSVSPFHLKQVFRNLFENALCAAPPPARIIVHCSPAQLGGQEAVRVAVCDNGPGIPAEQRDKLFEPFFTTKVHGTGLGLAICKRIVEGHGGRIEAAAGDGPGAEILITLPRRMA
jgi:PAS domain S-box-containing protein